MNNMQVANSGDMLCKWQAAVNKWQCSSEALLGTLGNWFSRQERYRQEINEECEKLYAALEALETAVNHG